MMYQIKNPSQLPATWQIAALSDISDINPKVDFLHLTDDDQVSFVPMPLVEELTGKLDPTKLEKIGKVKKGYTRFIDGDVLFAKITPCMENGKAAIAAGLHGGYGAGSTEFHVLRPYAGIELHPKIQTNV